MADVETIRVPTSDEIDAWIAGRVSNDSPASRAEEAAIVGMLIANDRLVTSGFEWLESLPVALRVLVSSALATNLHCGIELGLAIARMNGWER